MEAHQIVNNLLTYYSSVPLYDQALSLHDSLGLDAETWETRFRNGIAYAWGRMDYETRKQYCTDAQTYADYQEELEVDTADLSRQVQAGLIPR